MLEVPDYIDGAKLLKWAYSSIEPFGTLGSNEEDKVYGLAICQYEAADDVYRFSCNKEWEVLQDAVYNNVEEAILQLPSQYKNAEIVWRSK